MSKSKPTIVIPPSIEEYEEVITLKEKISVLTRDIPGMEEELASLQSRIVELEKKLEEQKIQFELESIEEKELESTMGDLERTRDNLEEVSDHLNSKRGALQVLQTKLQEVKHTAKLNRLDLLKKALEEFRAEHLTAVKKILEASDQLINLNLMIYDAEKDAGTRAIHFPEEVIIRERYPFAKKLIEQIWEEKDIYKLAKTCNDLNSRSYFDIPADNRQDENPVTEVEADADEKNNPKPGWAERKIGNSTYRDRIEN